MAAEIVGPMAGDPPATLCPQRPLQPSQDVAAASHALIVQFVGP